MSEQNSAPKFELEERYVVIKLKELKTFTQNELAWFMRSFGIKPKPGVVIEADWPEYKFVLEMLKNRVEGTGVVASVNYTAPQSND